VASSIAPIGMDVKPDPLAVAVVQPSTVSTRMSGALTSTGMVHSFAKGECMCL
jgi:hypothetical protein